MPNIYGDGSDNLLEGTEERDFIYGGDGNDTLYGYGGNDNLYGEWGNDFLYGGDGNDAVIGGEGNDYLDGGEGNDATWFNSPVTVDLYEGTAIGEGTDTLVSIEAVFGSPYNDVLVGNDEDNTLGGSGGNDQLFGNGGADFLAGGPGEDYIDGGAGFDAVSFRGNFQNVFIDLASNYVLDGGSLDTLVSIEAAFGTDYDDVILGNDGVNYLVGFDRGNSYLNPGSGSNFIGSDQIYAEGGDDFVAITSGTHFVDGGAGIDVISFYGVGLNNDDAVVFDLAVAQATGGLYDFGAGSIDIANFENIEGSYNGDLIIGDHGDNVITGQFSRIATVSDDRIFGGAGNDTLAGDGSLNMDTAAGVVILSIEENVLDGNDYVRGGLGDDTIYGNGGNDRLFGDEGNDIVYGGTGADILDGGDGLDELWGGDGNDVLRGQAGGDMLGGGEGQDILKGGAGKDNLSGGGDNDALRGNGGNDRADGGDGDDVVLGGGGVDVLLGGAGADTLSGGGRGDTLMGQNGNDQLSGDGGNDFLDGGSGDDGLTGGSGNDLFYFTATSGHDTITDFQAGDTIAFDASLGLDFADLVLTTEGDATVVTWGTEDSITVFGDASGSLDAADFWFGASNPLGVLAEAREALGTLADLDQPSFGGFDAKWGGEGMDVAMLDAGLHAAG